MAKEPVEMGPTGKRVAVNLARLRRRAGMQQRDLSGRLAELGRPMVPSTLSKIEQGDRRVDVDDLVALALALEVPPNQLLLSPISGDADDEVELTPTEKMSLATAWRVLNGYIPLPGGHPVLRATISADDAVALAGDLLPVTAAIQKAIADGVSPGKLYAWMQSVILAEATKQEADDAGR